MPRPVEALPCGSRSMIRTSSPIAASAVPRLIAVVVLPTPPFWLATTRILSPLADMTRSRRAIPHVGPYDLNHITGRISLTGMDRYLKITRFTDIRQFNRYILSLEKQPFGAL